MEILQVAMEKMGLSSKRLKASLVVFAIAFPLLLMVTLMYQNSVFDHFEEFPREKVLGGRIQNITDEGLRATDKNNVAPEVQVLAGKTQNFTDMKLEGRAKNFTASDVGSKKDSSQQTIIAAKKLVDGLLTSSGFDEESCLSRFQSYLYRKASPHKPSPYLISKLRNYEKLHKRCGPQTRSYNKTIIEIIKSGTNGAATNCKYIVWTPANGLGNRMISMAATFLYAVLTDRVLLVQFNTDMVGLFCEPFPSSSWILPEDFPFMNNQRYMETYESMLHKDKENNSQLLSPLVLHLNLQYIHNNPERFFHCDHSQDLLQKVAVLISKSDQYFVPSLFMIPSFNQELSKMFPEKDTVFHHLGRYLFQPSNEAWGTISRFYQAYLAKADERVGLQIRLFNPNLTPYQTIMGQILNCTLQHKVLPELDTRDGAVASPRKNQTLKSVLVTSLYPEYGENLRAMYLSKATVTGEILGVYQPSHEGKQKFFNNTHNIKALTEMYLLSLCDVLVTSSVSTFGYVAQSLGALKPWVLDKALDANIPNPACVRDLSMEPCYHYPPRHDCKGNSIHDLASVFPYTSKCADYSFGVKLVNDHE